MPRIVTIRGARSLDVYMCVFRSSSKSGKKNVFGLYAATVGAWLVVCRAAFHEPRQQTMDEQRAYPSLSSL